MSLVWQFWLLAYTLQNVMTIMGASEKVVSLMKVEAKVKNDGTGTVDNG